MNKEYSKVDFRDFPVREKDDKSDFRIFAKNIFILGTSDYILRGRGDKNG